VNGEGLTGFVLLNLQHQASGASALLEASGKGKDRAGTATANADGGSQGEKLPLRPSGEEKSGHTPSGTSYHSASKGEEKKRTEMHDKKQSA